MMSDTVLEIVAKEAVQMEGIRSYLGVVARNPLLSPLNQALLYFQNPKSGLVCGRTAWEAMGREVRADAVPVTLYVPEIVILEDGVRADYKVISVVRILASLQHKSAEPKRISRAAAMQYLIFRQAVADGLHVAAKTAVEAVVLTVVCKLNKPPQIHLPAIYALSYLVSLIKKERIKRQNIGRRILINKTLNFFRN